MVATLEPPDHRSSKPRLLPGDARAPPVNTITATTVGDLAELVGLIEQDADLNEVLGGAHAEPQPDPISLEPTFGHEDLNHFCLAIEDFDGTLLDRHGVIYLTAGVRQPPAQPGRLGENWVHTGVNPRLGKGAGPRDDPGHKWFHIRQNKHHRSSLDETQIYQSNIATGCGISACKSR